MRTTVTLDDELHELIRRRAFEDRRSFTEILNELVQRGITATASEQRRVFGAFKGKIEIADDFDDDLADIDYAMHEPIGP